MREDTLFDNRESLLSRGETGLREHVLQIVESGIRSVIPYKSTLKLIRREPEGITVGDRFYPAGKVRRIYIVGAGKGSFPIAQALDEIFGEQIACGFVVVKEGEKRRLPHIEIFESSHPIPDGRSVAGAKKIAEILRNAQEGDLVFAAVTGGSSALVNLPAEGITIEELRLVNDMLLKCGAEIAKINAVRKHLCMIKGGRVVQYGQPAEVITLTLDTAQPDMPWPDMCLPDPTTFEDAVAVLKSYDLLDKVPASVRSRLLTGLCHPEMETLKSLDGMNHAQFGVASPQIACETAAKKAAELGYEPHILSYAMSGEAKDVGIVLASVANEIVRYGRPFSAPCALISGGETTVTIGGPCGEGGPNQETALGFASKLLYQKGVAFASIDTDGTDGPCDIAGGLVDGFTRGRLKELGVDLSRTFQHHDSSGVLRRLGDELVTGHTGTNVMNLRVAVIAGEQGE